MHRLAALLLCSLVVAAAATAAPAPMLKPPRQPTLRSTFPIHTANVDALAFSPDGKTLAIGVRDGTIRLWDVESGKQRSILKGHTEGVLSVAFSPDGKSLASGSAGRSIKLWDVRTCKEKASLLGRPNEVISLAFSPDGKTLAAAASHKTVEIWDVKTGKDASQPRGRLVRVVLRGVQPRRQDAGVGGQGQDGQAVGREDGQGAGHPQGAHRHRVSPWPSAPTAETLASGSHDETIKLWDVKTGKERATLEGHARRRCNPSHSALTARRWRRAVGTRRSGCGT